MSLRIIVVGEEEHGIAQVKQGLKGGGDAIVASLIQGDGLFHKTRELRPDAIVVCTGDRPARILDEVERIDKDCPCPIVLFTAAGDDASIAAAVKAGVHAYVVDGLQVHRMRSILRTAIERFNETQSLRKALHQAESSLLERKTVERAKGILMKQRGMSEEGAYNALRRLAMARNKRLADVAESVISAAELLT